MDAVTHDKVSEQNVLELLAITIPSRLQYVTTIQSLLRYQLTYGEYYIVVSQGQEWLHVRLMKREIGKRHLLDLQALFITP